MPEKVYDERALDISRWSANDRAVIYKHSSERIVMGEIIGFYIKPNENFEAEILVKSSGITVYGTLIAGWRKCGDKVGEYQFVHEPEDVKNLRELFKQKRHKAIKAQLEEELGKPKPEPADDGFASDMDTEKEVHPVAGGRKGSGRVSAVKDARLPEDPTGKVD